MLIKASGCLDINIGIRIIHTEFAVLNAGIRDQLLSLGVRVQGKAGLPKVSTGDTWWWIWLRLRRMVTSRN